jgi:hypothetical protein
LLDPETGEYTLPYLPRVFGDARAAADIAVVWLISP